VTPPDPSPPGRRGVPGARLQARAVHRVTPDDIGQRVSIRHLEVTGASTPPRATDVVGRLLGYEAGVLAVVDRDRQLALVAEAAIVASRVVPPHPRLPAEPDDIGTAEHPLPREAARVLVLDDADRVLLVAHRASPTRTVWTAPGGGLRTGEDHLTAAARELGEELGIAAPIGPWIWHREVTFVYAGVHLTQHERWFLTRVEAFDPAAAPLDDPGLLTARWWDAATLRATDEVLAPGALADHLERLLAEGTPEVAVDVGR
jgi:8-oxo-dGTP pyrophosphatase MutT (NUDIX family)